MTDKYVPIADVMRAQMECQRRAGDNGVTVIFSNEVDTPCADSRFNIYIPTPKLPMKEEDWIRYRAALIHEPLHIKRKEAFKLFEATKLKNDHPIRHIWNVVEDDVMERQHLSVYYGDRMDMQADRQLEISDAFKSLESMSKSEIEDKNSQRVLTLTSLACAIRERWHPESVAGWTKVLGYLTDDSKDKLAKIEEAGIIERWMKATDCKEPMEISKQLYDILWEDEDKKAEEEIKQAQSGANSKGEGEVDKGEAKGDSTKKVPWHLLDTSDHSEKTGHMSGGGIDWEGKPRRREAALRLTPPKWYSTNRKTNSIGRYRPSSTADEQSLANHIRRMIQAKQRRYVEPEKLSGRLNTKELYRLAVPLRPGSDWNFRVFKKQNEIVKINTAVAITVDWSGSMCGSDKKPISVAAVCLLNSVFSRVLRVPLEITSFSSHGSQPTHIMIKDYKEQVSNEDICSKFAFWDSYSSGNADADSIMATGSKLLAMREERKILIVLSDGSPADGLSSPDSALLTVVKDLRKAGIELHGIGICDDNVKRYYGTNAQVVRDTKDLTNVLLSTMGNVLDAKDSE